MNRLAFISLLSAATLFLVGCGNNEPAEEGTIMLGSIISQSTGKSYTFDYDRNYRPVKINHDEDDLSYIWTFSYESSNCMMKYVNRDVPSDNDTQTAWAAFLNGGIRDIKNASGYIFTYDLKDNRVYVKHDVNNKLHYKFEYDENGDIQYIDKYTHHYENGDKVYDLLDCAVFEYTEYPDNLRFYRFNALDFTYEQNAPNGEFAMFLIGCVNATSQHLLKRSEYTNCIVKEYSYTFKNDRVDTITVETYDITEGKKLLSTEVFNVNWILLS